MNGKTSSFIDIESENSDSKLARLTITSDSYMWRNIFIFSINECTDITVYFFQICDLKIRIDTDSL